MNKKKFSSFLFAALVCVCLFATTAFAAPSDNKTVLTDRISGAAGQDKKRSTQQRKLFHGRVLPSNRRRMFVWMIPDYTRFRGRRQLQTGEKG